MKKTVFVAALLATASLGATAAHATGLGNLCETDRCSPNLADFKQNLDGLQKAINMIVLNGDAQDIVQNAVNAGNLINVGNAIQLANVEQSADLLQIAVNHVGGSFFSGGDIAGVVQSATNVANSVSSDGLVQATKQWGHGDQWASNSVLGGYNSALYGLEQAATNVVNTVTATTAKTVNQVSSTDQVAINVIVGGSYDADAVDWDATDVDVTQTQAAVNAANLVTLDFLTGAIKQQSYGDQLAVNKAILTGYNANVYDLGQSATNVANSVTVGQITPAVFDCLCYDGWEVNQYADVSQISTNLVTTMDNVTNTIQSATNIANSISIPSTDE